MVKVTKIYTDGGVCGKNPSRIGGTWAYRHVGEDGSVVDEQSGFISPEDACMEFVTNNHTELLAAVMCMEALPDKWSGILYTDSMVTKSRLRGSSPCHGVPAEFKTRMMQAKARLGTIKIILLKGHPTKAELARSFEDGGDLMYSAHNVACDEACTREARICFRGREGEDGCQKRLGSAQREDGQP